MATPLSLRKIAQGALVGGIAAGVICIGIYFAGTALGATYAIKQPEMMGGRQVLPFFQPMVNCVMAAVIAIGLLGLLNKLAGQKAWPIFLGVAALVFVAEAFMPPWVFSDLTTVISLELMHFPAAIGIIGGIHWAARSGARGVT